MERKTVNFNSMVDELVHKKLTALAEAAADKIVAATIDAATIAVQTPAIPNTTPVKKPHTRRFFGRRARNSALVLNDTPEVKNLGLTKLEYQIYDTILQLSNPGKQFRRIQLVRDVSLLTGKSRGCVSKIISTLLDVEVLRAPSSKTDAIDALRGEK